MATVAPPSPATPVKVKQKQRSNVQASPNAGAASLAQGGAAAPKTKAVIRKLPASMTKSDYEILFGEFLNDGSFDYDCFIPGKVPEDRNKSTTFSRVYAQVKSPEVLLKLRDTFHLRPFTDSRGQEFKALVEYAPFQKVPKSKAKVKPDSRQGTIDKDPEYISFLENLRHTGNNANIPAPTENTEEGKENEEPKVYQDPLAPPVNPYDAPIFDGKVTSTPLIDFIKQQKQHPKKDKVKIKGKDEEGSGGRKKRDRKGKLEREKEKERLAANTGNAAPTILTKGKAKAKEEVVAGSSSKQNPPTEPKAIRKERANASAAAAILQRDLLGGGGGRRRNRGGGGGEKDKKEGTPSETGSTSAAATSATPKSRRQRERERDREKAATGEVKAEDKTPTSPTSSSTPPTAPAAMVAEGNRRNRNRHRNPVRREESAPTASAPQPQMTIMKPVRRAETNVDSLADKGEDKASTETSTGVAASDSTTTPANPPTGPRNRNRGPRNNARPQQQAQAQPQVPAANGQGDQNVQNAPPSAPKGPKGDQGGGSGGGGDRGRRNGRRGGRGGMRGGGGGGNAGNSPAPPVAQPAQANTSAPS